MLRANRPIFLVALVAAGLIFAAAPASAATVVDQTGDPGHYVMADREAKTGATCTYETVSYDLDSISVRPPKVFARDTGTARDHQWVGWQFLIQKRPLNGGTWKTVHTSSVVEAFVYDNAASNFSRRTWTAPEMQNSRWRVEVVIRWYHFDTQATEGTVTLRLRHYTETWDGHHYAAQNFCPGHF